MCIRDRADAMVCISNCDKITPGMLMAAMRLNIPAVFVSGGPMEAGEWNLSLIHIYGVTQGSMEFAENRLSKSDGPSFDDAGQCADDGVTFSFYLIYNVCHFFCSFRVRITYFV